MTSPLIMQPAFFSLILISVHMSVLVDCTTRLQDPEQLLQHQQSSLNARAHSDTSTGTGRFYLELSGSMRKGIHRHFLVILPARTDTSYAVSIFNLRRKRFLCRDLKGDLYNSRQKDRDCLLQRIWLDLANRREVLTGRRRQLLKLEEAELQIAHQEPPEPPLALVEKFSGHLLKRQRRSEYVNPSDPLRSESHPSHFAKPDQDQAGAVSKETITFCDDPLRVLQPNGPVSPVKANIADRAEQD